MSDEKYGVHILGPDEYEEPVTWEQAIVRAHRMNTVFLQDAQKHKGDEFWPRIWANVHRETSDEEELPDDLVERYNPHPVMTTEWSACDEKPNPWLRCPDDNEEKARRIARDWEIGHLWKRQVTEWKEAPNE